MKNHNLQSRLRDRARPCLYGTCPVSTSPHFLAVAASCALDFVFIDTEHIALDREKLSWMCSAYAAMNIAPIVRVPDAYSPYATGALDGGACGIVSPYVESVEQVLALVGATKLRPLKGSLLQDCLQILAKEGDTAVGSEVQGVVNNAGYVDPLQFLGALLPANTLEFMRGKNDGAQVFINVESKTAIKNLPALLSIPGIDGVFIGPKDLSVQLGCPDDWENPVFLEACDHIVAETARRGLAVGCHYSFAHAVEYQKRWRSLGANLIIHESDLKLYKRALSEDLLALRSSDESRRESRGMTGAAAQDDDADTVPSAQVLDV
jgi:2-keto-3-deoxy-L-rhamnonate aldolase RhmA